MNKVLIGLISLSLAAAIQAETFTVGAGHAEVGFSMKHMMVSNTKGTFNTFEITGNLNVLDIDREVGGSLLILIFSDIQCGEPQGFSCPGSIRQS